MDICNMDHSDRKNAYVLEFKKVQNVLSNLYSRTGISSFVAKDYFIFFCNKQVEALTMKMFSLNLNIT